MDAPKITLIISDIIQMYMDKRVSRTSASLAYFLMLSIFPTLICLYAMLGNLFPTVQTIEELTRDFFPKETVETVVDYLGYVTMNSSAAMLSAALLAMATSSAAGFRTIQGAIGEINGGARYSGIFAFCYSFLFSLVFLAAIYFAFVVIVTGGWFIQVVDERISFFSIQESWEWVRFILLFAIFFLIIYGVYRITAPKGTKMPLLKGAAAAAVTLEIVSIVFSVFISMSTKYPLIYGSLASVMIIMFWLYLCGNILMLGSILNAELYRHR